MKPVNSGHIWRPVHAGQAWGQQGTYCGVPVPKNQRGWTSFGFVRGDAYAGPWEQVPLDQVCPVCLETALAEDSVRLLGLKPFTGARR